MAIKAGSAKAKGKTKGVTLPAAGAKSLHQELSQLRDRLNDALLSKGFFKKAAKDKYIHQWIEDVYGNVVVFSVGEDLYSASYTDKNGTITLGARTAVERRVVYVPKGS